MKRGDRLYIPEDLGLAEPSRPTVGVRHFPGAQTRVRLLIPKCDSEDDPARVAAIEELLARVRARHNGSQQ